MHWCRRNTGKGARAGKVVRDYCSRPDSDVRSDPHRADHAGTNAELNEVSEHNFTIPNAIPTGKNHVPTKLTSTSYHVPKLGMQQTQTGSDFCSVVEFAANEESDNRHKRRQNEAGRPPGISQPEE